MLNPVRAAAEALKPWLVETRRAIHMQPELGYEEHETAGRVAAALEEWGLEVRRGVARTGVVAVLRTGRPGPTLAIRADMDALPIEEASEVPYKSRAAGKMHACGHDAHTAMLLGAARLLAQNPRWLEGCGGNVKFIFQPAEEGRAGGRLMVEEGVLEDPRVDLAIAAHVLPALPVGTVGTRSGPVLAASDKFDIRIRGKGSHAAYPHLSRDPILAAAHVVTALQGIVSRNVEPFDAGVISVTRLEAGTAYNIIPDEVRLMGTMRTHREETREAMKGRMEETLRGVASAFGTEAEFEFVPGYPALVNSAQATGLIERAAREVLGEEKMVEMPLSMGAEDFAYIARQRPAAMFRVGVRNEARGIVHGLHSNRFDLDEDALPVGASVFAQAAREFLRDPRAFGV
ncbi:MAG: amidohydrolase [Candidatus Tectomicrobia bacterium]|uniref:Amidohydrolase n=1 Tax=Tectimicrobiota bacterium TaxID=2528274 RepID=A0A932ZUT2_UNCTE|nr:amidohydrolase [Candidatus Tectomicrobia bacterium]